MLGSFFNNAYGNSKQEQYIFISGEKENKDTYHFSMIADLHCD